MTRLKAVREVGLQSVGAETSQARLRAGLALAEDRSGPFRAASWVGHLVALGARASRYSHRLSGRQLVITTSVPARDFAGVLIGCGWMLASPKRRPEAPLAVMRRLAPGTPVRMVTASFVIVDHFLELDEEHQPPRVRVGSSQWQADRIRSIAVIPELKESERRRQLQPMPGSVSAMAGLADWWHDWLCCPPADLAIVGARTWLTKETSAYITRIDRGGKPDKIANILLPADGRAATWSTGLYSTYRFADDPALLKNLRAIVLDGASAIKYLPKIEAPMVFAVLDRSVADETAAEMIVQIRNSRGEPVSVRKELGWPPPPGIEALAFSVAL